MSHPATPRFDPGNRLICALDVPARAAADDLVRRLDGAANWLKIGLELFIAEGPGLVRAYVASGHRIMLDLKLHDIPATVGRAMARVAALGVELVTVHAAGGPAMLEAAREAAERAADSDRRPRVLAVTALTSLDAADLAAIGVVGDPGEWASRLAVLAAERGADGVVASPREAAAIRAAAPEGFLIVTPGVRPADSDQGDQKRVTTPRDAVLAGADLIVCGRPIRDAADPAAAARAIVAQLGSPPG